VGRNKKYQIRATSVAVSIDPEVLETIEYKAKKLEKNRSEYITEILRHFAYNEKEFCKLKARQAAQDLHYWKSKIETMDEHPELYQEITQ